MHVGPKEGRERLREGSAAVGGLRPSVFSGLNTFAEHFGTKVLADGGIRVLTGPVDV